MHSIADTLRASGSHRDVRVAFWKEEPALRDALLTVERPEVVAVPIFTSGGYFTDRVLPRELGIEPPVSVVPVPRRSGDAAEVRVRYTRPVGTHPRMADVVLERARDAAGGEGIDPGATTLVVLGHGTERHPESGATTGGVVDDLRRRSDFGAVRPAFLDEDPRIVPALEAVETDRTVVVPFFVSGGWHVGQTVPRELGLEDGRGRVGSTDLVYTDPVGTHAAMAEVVEALVAEALAGSQGRGLGGVPEAVEGEPMLPAVRARRDFLAWIDGAGPEGREFLQTRVRRTEPGAGEGGRYEIRHRDDGERPASELRALEGRAAVRSLATRTFDGDYRPLRTAGDLPPGWVARGLSGSAVWEAYSELYPAAPVHWHLERTGELRVTSFRTTAERQTGIYEPVAELTDDEVEETVRACCGAESCLRRLVWPVEPGGRPPSSRPARAESEVPCGEPCSLFVVRARKLHP